MAINKSMNSSLLTNIDQEAIDFLSLHKSLAASQTIIGNIFFYTFPDKLNTPALFLFNVFQ